MLKSKKVKKCIVIEFIVKHCDVLNDSENRKNRKEEKTQKKV